MSEPLTDPTAEALIAAGKRASQFSVSQEEREAWEAVHAADRATLTAKRAQYGDSWQRRGGTGAYHVGIRHMDRIENIASRHGYDLWAALEATADAGDESLLNAIGDLRRYLLLWEGEYRRRQDHRQSHPTAVGPSGP